MSYLKQLDESAWPVVYARFQGEATIAGFDEYARWLEGLIARAHKNKEHFVNVTDARGKMQVAPDVRRHMSDWLARQESSGLNSASLASIVIVDNMVIRGVMTAMSWVSRSQMASVSSVATPDDAWRVSLELIQSAGMKVPTRPLWSFGKAGT